jgi:pyruvate/2-oxoglutarate dehydrogenase complex dihydrolipoamide acyltransferase (E2) component
VVAPAAGTVSFAGTVAANGKSVTIETADGYSVTLTHLGSISVAKGATVAEQGVVGTVGPSGTPEVDGPYVHLGIRVTADPNGYVDPLGLLPPAAGDVATETVTTASQPAAKVTASTAPASKPARPAPSRPQPASAEPVRSRIRVRRQEPAEKPRARARATRARQRPAVRDRASEQRTLSERPEVSAPTDTGAGHEIRLTANVEPRRAEPSSPLLTLVCNVAAALFALGAALGARRHRPDAGPTVSAQVVCLPPREAGLRQVSRAA